MQAEKVYKSFVEKAKYYLKEIDYYGKYQFAQHPIEGKWSIGQLYDLLIHGTKHFHLQQIEDCLAQRNGGKEGKKNWRGKIVFRFRKFPFAIKGQYEIGYKPNQPESPAKLKDDLYRFLKVMNKITKEIDSSNSLDYKTPHSTLGMLNALEWLMLVDIHFKHYMKYKKSLDEFVRSHSKELASEMED